MPFLLPVLKAVRRVYQSDSDRSTVRDLLTDIVHYCNAHDMDFDKLCEGAKYAASEEMIVADGNPYPEGGNNE